MDEGETGPDDGVTIRPSLEGMMARIAIHLVRDGTNGQSFEPGLQIKATIPLPMAAGITLNRHIGKQHVVDLANGGVVEAIPAVDVVEMMELERLVMSLDQTFRGFASECPREVRAF